MGNQKHVKNEYNWKARTPRTSAAPGSRTGVLALPVALSDDSPCGATTTDGSNA